MIKKILPFLILFISGCSTLSSDDYMIVEGEKIPFSEIAKDVPYNHDPYLFNIQLIAKIKNHKEICTNLNPEEINVLFEIDSKLRDTFEDQYHISQHEERRLLIDELINGLSRHYKKTFNETECIGVKKDLNEYLKYNQLEDSNSDEVSEEPFI